MSDQNPVNPEKPEPSLDLSKAREAADKTADETAQVVNQYFGTELQAGNVHRIAGAVASIALTAGVAYWAGKRGVKAGMKSYIFTGQTLVDAAGNYADIAQQNALVASDNAAKSHEVLKVVGETVNKFEKAVKSIKK